MANEQKLAVLNQFSRQPGLKHLLAYLWPFADRVHFLHWTRRFSAYIGVQVAVQVIGLVSGLIVVRSLTKDEYAIYTVAGSALGLLTVLSDLGVNGALLALGGRVWQDNARLGQLIRAALKLRWLFFSIAVLVGGTVFFSLGLKAGAGLPYALLVFALLLGGGIFQLNYNVWSVVPRLHAHVSRLQKLDLVTAVVRLSLLVVAAMSFINSAVTIAVNSLGFVIQGTVARRWGVEKVPLAPRPSKADRREMLNLAASQMPNIIFYCFYGQVTVLIISIFGNTAQIAEVGALSRLGTMFSILGSVMSTIVLPRFARAQGRRDLARKYIQVIAVFVAGASGLLGLASLFPSELVWLLGGKYPGLQHLVGWVVASALVNSFVGVIWSLNTAKGWIQHAWVTIPVILAAQAILVTQLDLSSVRGAIVFGTMPLLSALLILIPIAYRGIRQTASA